MVESVEVSRTRAVPPEAGVPTIGAQQRFWDWHWEHWQERQAISPWALKGGERVVRVLRSLALERPRILDLGCGIGWFSNDFSQFGEVTGIDLSAQAIAQAQARYPHITFRAGNVLTAPLPARHFDVVISQEIFAHVENQARYLEVAAHALRPGGYLILTTANKFVLDRLGDAKWDPWPREHLETYYDMKGLKRLLSRYFRVLRTTTVLPLGNGGVLFFINSGKLNKALRWLIPARWLEALKERAGLGYCMIALAQKPADPECQPTEAAGVPSLDG